MNPTLKNFLLENPTADLVAVNTHPQVNDKKRVGSGQARGYFAKPDVGIWKKLKATKNDPENSLAELCEAVLITATDAQSYFGLDPELPDGIANRAGAEALVAGGIMTPDQKTTFLGMAISTTYPLSAVDQAELDAAKAELALLGELESYKTTYDGEELPSISKLKQEKLLINVIYDAPSAIDTSFQVFAETEDKESGEFIRETKPVSNSTIKVAAGKKTGSLRPSENYGSLNIRFVAVSASNQPLRVAVTKVG